MSADRLTLVTAQRIRRARERLHAQIDQAASAIAGSVALDAAAARAEISASSCRWPACSCLPVERCPATRGGR